MNSQAFAFEDYGAGRTKAATDIDETRQYVTFMLGEQHYCVDIKLVREIRAGNVITPLPSAPDFVRGVINLRGTIVPIIDLRARFGQGRTEATQNHVVVIVAIGGRLNGLLVDGVSDILAVRASEVAPVPETDGDSQDPFFDGLITQGDSMMILIAIERLLQNAPIREARQPLA